MRQLLIFNLASRLPMTVMVVSVMVVSPLFTGAVNCACAARLTVVPRTKSKHRSILRFPTVRHIIRISIERLTAPRSSHFEVLSSQQTSASNYRGRSESASRTTYSGLFALSAHSLQRCTEQHRDPFHIR